MRRFVLAQKIRFGGFAALLFIMFFSGLASAQSDLRILYSPMVLELAGERGSSVPFEITIMNDAPFSTAHFRATVTGLEESRDGVYHLRMDDDWQYGASSWIELTETEFSVPAGEFYVLRGVVRIPRQAPASGYATVITDLQGRRIRSVPLGSGRGVVIPQAALDFGSVIRGLAPGTYEVEARIEYGGHRPAVTRTTIEIEDDMAGVSGAVAGRAMRVDVTPAQIEFALQR